MNGSISNGYHTPEMPLSRYDLPQQPQQHYDPSLSPAPGPAKVLDLVDLELIHQWCTRTYITVTSRLTTHNIWRDVVFREGLRHEFLLRGIMATAALHKAFAFPEYTEEFQKYANAALVHQHAALQEYSPLTASPTPDNSVALFALAMLLTLITFGVERLPEDMKPSTASVTSMENGGDIQLPLGSSTRSFIGVIVTMRGILVVIHQTSEYLTGDIAEMMRYPKTEDLPSHPSDISRVFDNLAETAASYRANIKAESYPPEQLSDLLLQQVRRLRDITRCRGVVEWDSHIFSFLINAPIEFISLIKQGDSMALTILAHWAACFRCMDHHWWAVGWGEKLVLDIWNLLDRSTWAKAMDWPLQQCGMGDNYPSQMWNAS
jgi:hypothetical protein